MKTLPNKVFDELIDMFRQIGKNININPPENVSYRQDAMRTNYNQEEESTSADKSTQRALELSQRGIFACPKYTRLFIDDEDEMRIY
jgi:hypothetical protein